MKVAVEGCAHGELDKIYESIQALENRHGIKIDLLIICGDFQAVRNPLDLDSMAVPPKYRKLNTFYKYYSREKKAPILTVFVGGNHEASNYLSELPYGGWVCPNIYYMGYANVINVGGLRIAGLSGIYKGHDYLKGHFETPPYDNSTVKSVYHIRNVDVFRLKQIKKPVDICISHDWPCSVYKHGDMEQLLRFKPFFREEMESDKLGSPPGEELLKKLKPCYWFAAHLHCKFTAVIPHDDIVRPFTKFLALDKCLPKRRFLQVLDIGDKIDEFPHMEYDPEWLCILRNTNHLLNVSKKNVYMPGIGSEQWDFGPSENEIEDITKLFNFDMKVPFNFVVTAPTFMTNGSSPSSNGTIRKYLNPQTQSFCKLLSLTDPQEAVSSSDSFSAISENDCSAAMLSSPDEESCSDEGAEDSSQNDSQEFPGFFIDTVGSLGRKKKSDSSKSKNTSNSLEIPAQDTEKDPFSEIKTEMVKSLVSKNVQNFLRDEPGCSDVPVKEVEIELFPEIKEENVNSEVTSSSENSSSPFVFKRRNLSLYTNDESSETSEDNDGIARRFKRRNWPACHNLE